jgi:hypothetical protein
MGMPKSQMQNKLKRESASASLHPLLRTLHDSGDGPRREICRLASEPSQGPTGSRKGGAVVLRESGLLRIGGSLREGEAGDIFIVPLAEEPAAAPLPGLWTCAAWVWILYTAYRLFLLPLF